MTEKIVSSPRDRSQRKAVQAVRRGSLAAVVLAFGAIFACGSSDQGSKRCSSDDDCGLGMGCDLDDPDDGYCAKLCLEDTDCPSQQSCGDPVSGGECDDVGNHHKGRGVCDLYDGKYGPNSCRAAAEDAASGGSSASGNSSSAGRPSSAGSAAEPDAGVSGAPQGGKSGAGAGGKSPGGAGTGATGATGATGGSDGGVDDGCPDVCADPTPNDPMRISGLESGTGKVDPVGGRTGRWLTFVDGSGSTIVPTPGTTFTPYCGGASDSCFAACFAGTLHGTGYPFAYAGLTFRSTGAAYDVSSYTGVTFAVYGYVGTNSKLEFKVPTTAVIPVANGGTCSGTCYDDYNTDLTGFTTTSIGLYDVAFSKLAQDGYGTKVAWSASTVTGLEWHVTSKLATLPADEDYVICIDEVRFSGLSEGGIAN